MAVGYVRSLRSPCPSHLPTDIPLQPGILHISAHEVCTPQPQNLGSPSSHGGPNLRILPYAPVPVGRDRPEHRLGFVDQRIAPELAPYWSPALARESHEPSLTPQPLCTALLRASPRAHLALSAHRAPSQPSRAPALSGLSFADSTTLVASACTEVLPPPPLGHPTSPRTASIALGTTQRPPPPASAATAPPPVAHETPTRLVRATGSAAHACSTIGPPAS